MSTLYSGESADAQLEELRTQICELQKEKEKLLQELGEEKSLRREHEDIELEKVELKKKVEDLKSINEGLQEGISYKTASLKEKEEEALRLVAEIEEMRQKLVDREAANEILNKKMDDDHASNDRMELEQEEIQMMREKLAELNKLNEKLEMEVKNTMDILKAKEEENAEMRNVKEELEKMRVSFAELEKSNEESCRNAGGKDDTLKEDNVLENEEVEELKLKLDELGEMNKRLREEIDMKDALLEKNGNKNSEQLEGMGSIIVRKEIDRRLIIVLKGPIIPLHKKEIFVCLPHIKINWQIKYCTSLANRFCQSLANFPVAWSRIIAV